VDSSWRHVKTPLSASEFRLLVTKCTSNIRRSLAVTPVNARALHSATERAVRCFVTEESAYGFDVERSEEVLAVVRSLSEVYTLVTDACGDATKDEVVDVAVVGACTYILKSIKDNYEER